MGSWQSGPGDLRESNAWIFRFSNSVFSRHSSSGTRTCLDSQDTVSSCSPGKLAVPEIGLLLFEQMLNLSRRFEISRVRVVSHDKNGKTTLSKYTANIMHIFTYTAMSIFFLISNYHFVH
jgi:hypothetical protein